MFVIKTPRSRKVTQPFLLMGRLVFSTRSFNSPSSSYPGTPLSRRVPGLKLDRTFQQSIHAFRGKGAIGKAQNSSLIKLYWSNVLTLRANAQYVCIT